MPLAPAARAIDTSRSTIHPTIRAPTGRNRPQRNVNDTTFRLTPLG
jgi:hypothetical protein